jgi:hypothetical protein
MSLWQTTDTLRSGRALPLHFAARCAPSIARWENMLPSVDVATRGEALARAQTLLHDLVQGIPSSERPRYSDQVLEAWAARLRAESVLAPFYPVPVDVSVALAEIAESIPQIRPEALIDWIDLIGQSVLRMVDVQSVVREVPAALHEIVTANYHADSPRNVGGISLDWLSDDLVPMGRPAAA